MLAFPSLGMGRRCTEEHNNKTESFCDWIEGNVLFCEDGELSKPDVVDILIEQQIYDEEGFAYEWVESAWELIESRLARIGKKRAPFTVQKNRIERKDTYTWKEVIPYSFCLFLSLSECYESWSDWFPGGHNEQGHLFEKLTKESLASQLKGWEVSKVGWSGDSAKKIAQVAAEVADLVKENVGAIEEDISSSTNEAGLDVVCYKFFPHDNRTGYQPFLVQCASGKNWKKKLSEPNLNVWNKAVNFAVPTQKKLVIPFSLDDAKEFRQYCIRIGGVLLDRSRLLSPYQTKKDWLTTGLKTELRNWLKGRIEILLAQED